MWKETLHLNFGDTEHVLIVSLITALFLCLQNRTGSQGSDPFRRVLLELYKPIPFG